MKKFISANQLKRHMITHSGKIHTFNSLLKSLQMSALSLSGVLRGQQETRLLVVAQPFASRAVLNKLLNLAGPQPVYGARVAGLNDSEDLPSPPLVCSSVLLEPQSLCSSSVTWDTGSGASKLPGRSMSWFLCGSGDRGKVCSPCISRCFPVSLRSR